MRKAQERGQVLLLMLAILTMGAAWFLVSKLDVISGNFTPARTQKNATVLLQAKQALIGYVAMKAASISEDQPGALPCPEAAASVGGVSEGTSSAGSLTLPTVGRLPWKTL